MVHSKKRQTVPGSHHIYAQNFTCAGQISACLRLKREATLSTLEATCKWTQQPSTMLPPFT